MRAVKTLISIWVRYHSALQENPTRVIDSSVHLRLPLDLTFPVRIYLNFKNDDPKVLPTRFLHNIWRLSERYIIQFMIEFDTEKERRKSMETGAHSVGCKNVEIIPHFATTIFNFSEYVWPSHLPRVHTLAYQSNGTNERHLPSQTRKKNHSRCVHVVCIYRP